MTKREMLDEIAAIMDLEEGSLSGDEKLEDLPWTSLTAMAYVALCDYKFDVSLNAADLKACHIVNHLLQLVSEHLSDD